MTPPSMRSPQRLVPLLLSIVAIILFGVLLLTMRGGERRGPLSAAEAAPEESARGAAPAPLASGIDTGSGRGPTREVEPRTPDPVAAEDGEPRSLEVRVAWDDGTALPFGVVAIVHGDVVVRSGRTDAAGTVRFARSERGWEGCRMFVLQGNALLAEEDLEGVGAARSVSIALRSAVRGRVLVQGRPPRGPVRLVLSAEERTTQPPPCPSALSHTLLWMEQSDEGPSTWTDAEGRFTLGGLDPAWRGRVLLDDFLRLASGELALTLPAPRDDLVLELEPPYAVRGRVLTPAGEPASLCAYRLWYLTEGAAEYYNDFAGVDGRFLIPLHWSATGEGEVSFADPRYGAVKCVFPPLSEDGADLGDVILSPGRQVLCRVRDEEGRPVEGALISTVWRHSDPSGSDGICRIASLPYDVPSLHVEALGFLPEDCVLPASPDGSEAQLEVTLRRAPSLEVRILGPDGAPARGARLEVRGERPFETDNGAPDFGQERLGASEIADRGWWTGENGVSTRYGIFEVRSEDPLLVTSLGRATPIELRVTDWIGRELCEPRWVRFDGAKRRAETFRLSDPLVTWSGTVLDGADEPVSDLTLTLRGPHERSVDTGRDGTFSVSSLAPRPFEVHLESPGTTPTMVRIDDPARASVLRVDRGRLHDLIVRDATGSVLRPDLVNVFLDGERVGSGELQRDGSVHFEHLPNAPVLLQVDVCGRSYEVRPSPDPTTVLHVEATSRLRVLWPFAIPPEARALMILVGPEGGTVFHLLEPAEVEAREAVIPSVLPGDYEVQWTLYRQGELAKVLARRSVTLRAGEEIVTAPPGAEDDSD